MWCSLCKFYVCGCSVCFFGAGYTDKRLVCFCSSRLQSTLSLTICQWKILHLIKGWACPAGLLALRSVAKVFLLRLCLNSADSARRTAGCIQWCYSYSMLPWRSVHDVTCKSDKLDYARQAYKKLGSSEHVGEAVEAGKVNHSCYFHSFASGTSII